MTMSPNCIPFDPLPQLTKLVEELTEAYERREKEYSDFIASCERVEEEEERVRQERVEHFDREIEAQEFELNKESLQAELQLHEQHRDEHNAMKKRHSAEAENMKDQYEARRASVPARQSKIEFEEAWRRDRDARFADRARVKADLIARNATENYKRALNEIARIFDLPNIKNGNNLPSGTPDPVKKDVKDRKDGKRSSNHKRPWNSVSNADGDARSTSAVSPEDSSVDLEFKHTPESTTSTSTTASKSLSHSVKRQKPDESMQNYEYLGTIDWTMRVSDQNYKSLHQPRGTPEGGGFESIGSIVPTKQPSKKEILRAGPSPSVFEADNPTVTMNLTYFNAESIGNATSPGVANASLRFWKASDVEPFKTIKIRLTQPATSTLTSSPSSSSTTSTNTNGGHTQQSPGPLIRISVDSNSDPHFSFQVAHVRQVAYDITTRRLKIGRDEYGSKVVRMVFYDVMELRNCMAWYEDRGVEVLKESLNEEWR